jgi:hypothetical protein
MKKAAKRTNRAKSESSSGKKSSAEKSAKTVKKSSERKSKLENKRAADVQEGRVEKMDLSNAELKRLLDRALVRFGNWKVQMETNPNPKIVHNLKSIVSIIDTITSVSERKILYSYKDLSRQMSNLIDEVAKLNVLITDSLLEDDAIDDLETERINSQMMTVIQRTVELIRLVQQAFGTRTKLLESPVSSQPAGEEMAEEGV